ncbi:MAG: response regulator [Deltaproteobacteria bacterium]|nr:response regulator [Deltaproteobacteria bacterium]
MLPDTIRAKLDAFRIDPADSPILVVDDEPAILELMTMALDEYPVIAAESVAQARGAIVGGHYRLVITDKNLPDGTGLDVIAEAKQHLHPHTEYIVITGYGNLASAVEAIELGIFGYIEKPFDLSDMKKYVQGALARNEAFFKNEFLVDELSRSHAELFRKQTELDIAGEIAADEKRAESMTLVVSDLLEALTQIGTSHAELAESLEGLRGNKKVAKLVGPGVVERALETSEQVAQACARYAEYAGKRNIELSQETHALIRALMKKSHEKRQAGASPGPTDD